jgi:alanine dehydrogenase
LPRRHGYARSLGKTALVFTAGGYPTGSVGLRLYGTWPGDSDQAVLVWDPAGRLRGCIVGTELGARRTGAFGAAAVDALARPEASVVGIIGSGRQAWTQLWALTGVHRPSDVRVFSPNQRTGKRSPSAHAPNSG